MKKLKNILMSNVQSLSNYISESILSSSGAGKANIEAKLAKYGMRINKIKYNTDGTIDYDGDVFVKGNMCENGKLPFRFNVVNGDFYCDCCKLTTLDGAPREVHGSFSCSNNKLTTLEGCPKIVDGHFICSCNKLTSLNHVPQNIKVFDCSHNELTTLEGSPQNVTQTFNCTFNRLKTLEGGPKYCGLSYLCYVNNLTDLKGCPEIIGGPMFDCSENSILTFKNGPKVVNDTKIAYNSLMDKKWYGYHAEGNPLKGQAAKKEIRETTTVKYIKV